MKRALLSLAAACLSLAAPAAAAPPDEEVFYHIFTRSMRDSNADGQGDLRGIIQSLDYLKRLGVTSILLTPLYPSDFYHNYFANDFNGIDPEYGTMEDYRALVAAVHARGMKLYLDQEIQYVAYPHPWYAETLGRPQSRWGDYLIWHGPNYTKPEEGPFGITLAKRFPDGETGITTVNMKSPAVKRYFRDYLLRWMDPNGDGDFSDGADGYRLDHMMDDLDNKGILTNLFADFWAPILKDVRALNPRFHIIAEQWDWGDGRDFLTRGGADSVFAFPLAGAIRDFDAAKIAAAIERLDSATPAGKQQLLFVENHDMGRIASLDGVGPAKLRTAASLSILLEGTPILYYGQELGMHGKGREEYKSDEKDIGNREAFEWNVHVESPGHANWYRSPKSYWTERFSKDDDGISVAEQDKDPKSLLNHYRRLLALRAEHAALSGDGQRIVARGPLLVIERSAPGESFRIVSNLSGQPQRYDAKEDLLELATASDGGIVIGPWETALVRAD